MSLRDEFTKSDIYAGMVKDPYDGRLGPDGKFMWLRLEYAFLGYQAAQARIEALEKKIDDLKTVMVAAAEEIYEHWDAHCDKEGYGPANLMNRLERGLASTYSCYSPGAFAALHKKVADLEAAIKQTGNYTASDTEQPKSVHFANGRLVTIVDGALEVSWLQQPTQEQPNG